MRDLLPEEARLRRALSRRLLDHFALYGYQLVTPPVFEFAEVLERGLGTLDPSDVLRFVEPESGEVAALRPDMTPQIARMVATRLGREPLPIRLCYEGTIVRRRQGRARRHRQIPQAGVELYGSPKSAGDIEILRLAREALRAAKLRDFVIDLGHAKVARTLLEALPPGLAEEVSAALEQKDIERIHAELHASPASAVPAKVARALLELSDLHGGDGTEATAMALFRRAEAILAGTPAEGPLEELRALFGAAIREEPDLAPAIRLDLGEVRGFAYYTGMIFHLLARGPGEPIGAGGRYDALLARFDMPMPAVGFALHLDAIAWARQAQGVTDERPPSVLIAQGEPLARELAQGLRARGIAAALHPEEGAFEYAAAWHFTHLIEPAVDGALPFTLSRVTADVDQRSAPATPCPGDAEALARLLLQKEEH